MAKAKKPVIGAARRALLESACALFAERGFEGASTHQIAHRARVPQGLIRHHFGNKEALWREVVGAGLDDLSAALDRAGHGRLDPADSAAIWTELLLARRALLQLLLHALVEPGPRRTWLLAHLASCTAVRSLVSWARGDQAHERQAEEAALLICMRLASLCSVPALLAVLETLRGRALDHASVASMQRDLLAGATRVAAPSAVAGPWSLAAAAQRRARAARAD